MASVALDGSTRTRSLLAASLALGLTACGGASSLGPTPLSGAADGVGAPSAPTQTTFVVSGTVRSGDTPLANVAIELEGHERYNTHSDPEGAYRFAQVARGEYALRASTAGFTTAEQGLMVEADVTSDLSLTPASPPAPSPAPPPAPTPNPTPTPSPTPAPNPSPNPTPAPPSPPPAPTPAPTPPPPPTPNPTPAPTLHRLYGRTTDALGGLADVRVDLVSGPDAGRTTYSVTGCLGGGACTGVYGNYEFRDLRSGAYVVRFSRDGFRTRDVQQELRGDTELNVQLEKVWLPPQTGALEGTVQDSVSYQAIEGVRVVATGGAGAGRATTTNGTGFFRLELPAGTSTVRFSKEGYDSREVEYPISAGATTINAGPTLRKTGAPPPLPPSPSLYFGYVTDGQGRPVVGAKVCGAQYCGYTDANGRYEFQGWSRNSSGTVYPPEGYEPKPVRVAYGGFPLYPGGQNITIRRITNASMSPPATLAVGAHRWVYARVSFDDGKTESPVADLFVMTSSDTGVVKVGSGNGLGPAFVEGVKAGIASVSGRYFGVSTAMFQVQVVR